MSHFTNMKKADMLKLPVREWDKVSTYDSVCIIPTRKKHDSGYAIIAIVGLRASEPVEIACLCADDIEWLVGEGVLDIAQLRMDATYPAGIIHVWSKHFQFTVGETLSSTRITVVKK
jgi:hypothetical protein